MSGHPDLLPIIENSREKYQFPKMTTQKYSFFLSEGLEDCVKRKENSSRLIIYSNQLQEQRK